MRAEHLVFEVTRRCNMKCEHCLRGPAQRVDMDPLIMYDVLNTFSDGVYELTFTGGEPLLRAKKITEVLTFMRWRGKIPEGIFLKTNGLKYSEELVEELNRMHSLSYNSELYGVEISADKFHKPFYRDRIANNHLRYQAGCTCFRDVPQKYAEIGPHQVLAEGRAVEWGAHDVSRTDEPIVRVNEDCYNGMIYVNAKGYIVDNCNLSYNSQKKRTLCYYTELRDYLQSLPIQEVDQDE